MELSNPIVMNMEAQGSVGWGASTEGAVEGVVEGGREAGVGVSE